MDRDIAQRLFDELKMHQGIIKPDEDIFLNMLLSAEVPESSRFYEELPLKEQILNEFSQEKYVTLSLRRIIRNQNAKRSEIKGIKKLASETFQLLHVYSSTDLTRKLRENEYLIFLMGKSAEERNPFSLLGKIEECDWSNPSGTLYRRTSPVLIIPGFANELMGKWEDKNAVYEKEILFFKKRITKEEYLSQGKN